MKVIVASLIALLLAVACAPATPSRPALAPPQTVNADSTATPRPAAAAPQATEPSALPAEPTVAPSTGQAGPAGAVPSFGHIYLIVMENKSYSDIVGNSSAPYINSLIARFGLATNYSGVGHPSQPNYLALFSGSTQGVTNDNVHNVNAPNLADQLEAKGKTWRVFAQNFPSDCFTGQSSEGGVDGAGTYVRRHNPAISFVNISSSATRCENIKDLKSFNAGAADFEFIAPNLCNDMHDCPADAGDKWLSSFIPQIMNSAAFKQDGVIFITWDEGSDNDHRGGGGQVATIVISSRVQPGFQSSVEHNHYSLLHTIEEAWGLDCLDKACQANTLSEFFK